jgi:hypothetical protein
LTSFLCGCRPPEPRLDAEHIQGRLVSELPAGWKVRGPRIAVRPEALGVFTEYEITRSGKSGCILSVDASSADWGTLMQSFYADDYRGKRVRFSGWLKTFRVDGSAALWMGVDTESLEEVAFDDMEDRIIQGTTDWTRYSIVLDVDEYAALINIGVKLYGTGQVWIDDCTFEVVDKGVPVTDQFPLGSKRRYELRRTLFYEPLNLNFDEETIE